MKHTIPENKSKPLLNEMANAVAKCVHCGFCLPACPTYKVLEEEMDSPRGRIILMKSVLEEGIDLEEAMPYIDHCLGCLSCESACPSGVPYGKLLSPFRSLAEQKRHRPARARLTRWITKETFPFPGRFRFATRLAKFAKPTSRFVSGQLRAMLDLVPDSIPRNQILPPVYPARGTRRAKVALQTGCVQQVLAQEINWATLRVLSRNGIEVVVPQNQGCCGALALHSGDRNSAKSLALHNLNNFPDDVDAIITNAAGCGSCMHEYPLLFRGSEFEELAIIFDRKVTDISVFLNEINLEPIPTNPYPIKAAYHDACHLAHAQKITQEPRDLLLKVTNLTIMPIEEADICCGSAGSYNLEHPDIAQQLGQRKAKNILDTGADVVITGNIGCLVQLRAPLSHPDGGVGGSRKAIPVLHTIEFIDQAYQEKLKYNQ
jgi:glycolate oxidase iron-sulfur subunit